MRATAPALTIAGLLVACGGPDAGASSFGLGSGPAAGPGSTGEGASTTGAAPGSSTGAGPEDSSSAGPGEGSTSGVVHDVGGADFGELQPAGCKGKIDFLFVISRLGVMEEMQARLIDAFPKFIATIESKFADFDYHIMVVDGDGIWGSPICTPYCPALDCKVGEPCCPVSIGCDNGVCVKAGDPCCDTEDYPCDVIDTVDKCDEMMGAGTVFNAGRSASNHPCALAAGRRYLTREQPQLAESFACIAQVGLSGGDRIGEAVMTALSPELTEPGGCNEGFLRDDALLMITFIYGTGDTFSVGKPKLWADAVLAAKHDDPGAVVMFSIAYPECAPQDRVCDLVKYYFPHWYIADNAAEDYGPAFEVATDQVTEACSEFIPQ